MHATMNTEAAETALNAALKLVESKSIREWVQIPKHRAAWLRFISEGKVSADALKLSTVIVIEAIGL